MSSILTSDLRSRLVSSNLDFPDRLMRSDVVFLGARIMPREAPCLNEVIESLSSFGHFDFCPIAMTGRCSSMAESSEPLASDDPDLPRETPAEAAVIRQFVEHWGMMARSWGINPTMGELFALLYITGTDWTADGLRHRLKVSRGNVSMNLRELIAWGVVHKVHRQGERREYFRAETDIWTLFRRILLERKRRELDPTLVVLDRAVEQISGDPELAPRYLKRIGALRRFFALVHALAARVDALGPAELEDLVMLLEHHDSADSDPSVADPSA